MDAYLTISSRTFSTHIIHLL